MFANYSLKPEDSQFNGLQHDATRSACKRILATQEWKSSIPGRDALR